MGITKTQMGVGGASKMEFLSDCFLRTGVFLDILRRSAKSEVVCHRLNQASTFNNNGPKLAKLPN